MTDMTVGSDNITPCSLQNEKGISSGKRNFPGVVNQIQGMNSAATGCCSVSFPIGNEKIKIRVEMACFSKLVKATHLVFKFFLLSQVFRI